MPTGKASVYDARTGGTVLDCTLPAPAGPFINDVVVTRDAAYFTNSRAAELYRMPVGRKGPSCDIETIRLRGEWEQTAEPAANNANGIDATWLGTRLVVVNSTVGAIYAVNPRTGYADKIDTDVALTNGDGILLRGRELSVVRNRDNEVVVLRLSWDLSSGRAVDTISDPDFDVPTTLAAFGRSAVRGECEVRRDSPDDPSIRSSGSAEASGVRPPAPRAAAGEIAPRR